MAGGRRYMNIADIALFMQGSAAALPAAADAGTYRMALDTADGRLKLSIDGTAFVPVSLGSPLSHLILVDGVTGNDTDATIDNGIPFATMQAAVSAIVVDNAISPLGRKGYSIFPAPFQQFDEDLTIDVSNALHLSIIAQGGWMLGDFSAANWRPVTGVGRDLILTGSALPVDGIRPAISIQTAAWVGWNPTSNESFSGPRIAGRIDGTAMTGGNLEFAFEGEVFGEGHADAADFGTTIVSSYWRDVRLKKPIGGTNLLMFKSWDSRFQGLVSCAQHSGFFNCELEGGLTTSGNAGVPPQGFYDCDLQGTFTGPASAWLYLDPASNYWFKTNGATIAGGGSKTIIGDLVP